MPESPGQKKFAELREKYAKLRAETQKKTDALLNDGQRKRLRQIEIQVRGIRAFSDKSVAKELGLSSDQQDQIKASYESQQEKYRAVAQDVRDGKIGREKAREKYAEVRKGIESSILGVLTDEQKKKFEEMKGKKFELNRSAVAFHGSVN